MGRCLEPGLVGDFRYIFIRGDQEFVCGFQPSPHDPFTGIYFEGLRKFPFERGEAAIGQEGILLQGNVLLAGQRR